MRLLELLLLGLLFYQQTPSSSATTNNTLSRNQSLAGDQKLVSSNGKFALGFFQTGSKSSNNTPNSYLGIWFHRVPKLTPVWTANGDNPISGAGPTSPELIISDDGNLVILAKDRVVWSTQANVSTKDAAVVLLNNGNLVLQSSLNNTSDVFWQSFDHPTDTFMMEAKLGWNKVTGLNRRLVSRKNSIDQASGLYSMEFSLDGIFGLFWNSSVSYWNSGEWNGRFFSSIPEMAAKSFLCNYTFVNNDQEVYFSTYCDENVIFHNFLGVSGLWTNRIWMNQDWVNLAFHPQRQCDVHAACGPFAVCTDNANLFCDCMKGFSARSPQDWGLGDTQGGCTRNTPLSFCGGNRNTTSMTDKFYSMPSISRLPDNGRNISGAMSAEDCAEACLHNCSCTAYSYGEGGCSVWHDELLNVAADGNGETLYLRLAAKEVRDSKSNRSALIIGVATSTSVLALGLLVILIVMWRRKWSWSRGTKNNDYGIGVTSFNYMELRRATKNFSEKLGEGGFGSVYKGSLTNSVVIAVKRLDRVHQGEKQFRAEVSSLGIIQHINLVKLIGFCCEGDKRLLVYEHMPNRSLDAHLFQTQGTTTLDWGVRYQIALGVARGLAYLHHSCRDCIIHCDIKPQNILLNTSFLPKIADFGLAKFLGRDFNRVMTTMRGTIGYMAPEWISGTAITSKVDVYSYGMVLLEIISGKRNSDKVFCSDDDHGGYFPVQVAHKLLDGDVAGLVDANLHGDVNLEEVERICKVACWCIQDNEFDRPTMGEVVQFLEGVLEPNIPPMPRLLHAITKRHQESAVKDAAASTFQSQDSG